MALAYGQRLLDRVLSITPKGGTAINVGVWLGKAVRQMLNHGLEVEGFSIIDVRFEHDGYTHRKERFEDAEVTPVDLLWTSMTIEHMPNVGLFLQKCRESTKVGGVFAIVAPSDKQDILVDGHLSFWTPAHLIYNMVVAGWDCSKARWYTEGRDIALYVRRKDRHDVRLNYDNPDLKILSPYFPCPLIHRNTDPWLEDNFD